MARVNTYPTKTPAATDLIYVDAVTGDPSGATVTVDGMFDYVKAQGDIVLTDGSVAMTGNLDLGDNEIVEVNRLETSTQSTDQQAAVEYNAFIPWDSINGGMFYGLFGDGVGAVARVNTSGDYDATTIYFRFETDGTIATEQDINMLGNIISNASNITVNSSSNPGVKIWDNEGGGFNFNVDESGDLQLQQVDTTGTYESQFIWFERGGPMHMFVDLDMNNRDIQNAATVNATTTNSTTVAATDVNSTNINGRSVDNLVHSTDGSAITMIALTQAAYDALTPDANTVYLING